jgi:ubiquinone/menaquinone biosynthesis C-methylase UbiE
MAERSRDIWAEWLLDRGAAGGDKAGWLEFLRPVRDRVLNNARLSEGDTLLDVGAGDGMIAFGALERMGEGGKAVFADVSEDLLDHSRVLAEERGVADRCSFVLAPATDLSAIGDGSVDAVTTRSALLYVGDKRRAFEEFHRVLKPSGRLSICEGVASFREPEPRGVFLGCDVRAVVEAAERVKAFYHRAQPSDSDPMHDFDERDLLRCAEDAGFAEVHLDFEAVVARGNPPGWGETAWDILAKAPPNPQVPSLEEVAERELSPEGAERLLAHLKALVEAGRRTRRHASAYLRAVKLL